MKPRNLKFKIFSLVFLTAVFVLLMWFVFSGENVAVIKSLLTEDHSQDEFQDKLRDFGLRGYITFSILSMLQVIFAFLPAEPVQILAGVTFGFLGGAAACTVGVVVGNTIVFVLYKALGNKLNNYFDKNLDIDFEKASASGKITTLIFILYFLPAIPYGMICFLAATMRMRYPKYIIVTVLGSIPSICIGVALGHMAISTSWIISVAVFVVLVAMVIVLLKKKDVLIKRINAYISDAKNTSEVKFYSKLKLSLLYLGSRIVFFFKGVKLKYTNNVGKIEKPCIVLCNHGSFCDFAYAGTLLKKHSPNFIVNRMYFYNKKFAEILHAVGCFPKSMFVQDLESMKNCLKVIRGGGVLAMMPEARLSTSGKFEDIQDGTFSFIKKLGVPVYYVKINGNYLAKPKWADKFRRGSLVEASLNVLFTKDELFSLTDGEVRQRATEALYYDELEWLDTKPNLKYRSKNIAKGLENILPICPICKSKYTLESEKHVLRCSCCDFKTSVNNRYSFDEGSPFKNFSNLYDWQSEEFKKEIASNKDFKLVSNVILKSPSLDGKSFLRESGRGVCTFNRNGLTYIGTKDGINITKEFPISDIYRILFGAGENFEIYDNKEIYFFVPEEPRSAVSWYIASKIIKENPDI